ncbi:UDP-glucose iridoid glucosyltransferase-like [Salvia miltiorrhiza]|uniref:UDP-glucose iridoid glucosyltransferase-like n=1 Tax=Salvia miltiorrhiza TaxID=226208 RepID=UPI0025AC8DED|nr:UDP-glucose iridoid glucosyltransferase-like [Salvia miltiorrhiza]
MAPLKRRVVLVPYPFQGHLTPMLQLAALLHRRGFSITVAHTRFNSPTTSNYPQFAFAALSDGLEGRDMSFYNALNVISEMNANCQASFREHLLHVLEEEGEELVCVIYDNIMKFVDVVADSLNLPTIVLRTTAAAFMHSHLALFDLAAHKRIPLPECELELPVPNLHPLRYNDLPLHPTREIPESVQEFLESYMNIRSSAAVIWNTVEALDEWPLQQLQRQWPVPFFTIGPLHKMAPPLPTSLIEEDTMCLSWLDKRAPGSVIYVSLGSMAIIDEDELCEMARGLARSEQPFLWVVRTSLLNGSDAIASLPGDFGDVVRGRGLVVEWAPQRKVLEHPAVGGFFTHCGWNSTLESLCEGVPMICRPCFADQLVNARYLTHVWGVGVELGSVVEKGVEEAVRMLMKSDCGREMRERAAGMKLEIERCMGRGGSSSESLDHLLEFVDSL